MNGIINGYFDMLHYGHITFIFNAKQKCKDLTVVVCNDNECYKYKNTYPIFNYDIRYELLKNCRFINNIISDVPYNIDEITLMNLNCDKLFYGTHLLINNELYFDKNIKRNTNNLNNLYKIDKLEILKKTEKISNENLLERISNFKNKSIINKQKNYFYLKYIFIKIQKTLKTNNNINKYILLNCCWDFFNINHIYLLEEIKKKYPNTLIIADMYSHKYDRFYQIYNKWEMAITLLGIKLIDNVMIYNKKCIYGKMKISIMDNDIMNKIKNLTNLKLKIINNIHISKNVNHVIFPFDKYKKILKSQFDNILFYIKNIQIKPNDILVFDIDEVCLNNLMYNNIHHKLFIDYIYPIFTYKNGLNPLNKEILCLFNYIHKHKIKYAFITGRRKYIKNITIKNLKIFGLNYYSKIFFCPNDFNSDILLYKEKCRCELNKKYNVLFTIGDQLGDLTGKYIGVPFLIFNPYYINNI